VKNSFGTVEVRYKVKMLISIAGVKVRANVTLADRKRNSFPMLIGRRTLKSRFVVDVSKNGLGSHKNKLLILSERVTPTVGTFARNIERYGKNLEVHHADYNDVIIRFIDGVMSATLQSTGDDIAKYDIVHFKTSETRDITASLAHYCIANGTKILDPIVQHFPTTSKLYEYVILNNNGIRIPDSIFMTPRALKTRYKLIVKDLSLPFVLKGIHESKGEHNYLIKSEADYKKALQQAEEEQVYLIAQKFIPNESDYRIVVLGQSIDLVIERTKHSDTTHLNNTSKGGSAILHPLDHLPVEVQHDSLRAAALMGRDVAGVDMMRGSEDGLWYCLEVNDGPQLAGGAYVEEKAKAFAHFINRKLGE
jgi:glutathione synthase/RimK-type ligase-like ATP-grasp enzyme